MDVPGKDGSQLRRVSLKRPWEEDTILPEKGNAWQTASLPPTNTVPFRRISYQQVGDVELIKTRQYSSPTHLSALKKPKFDSYDYNPLHPRGLETSGDIPPPRKPSTSYISSHEAPTAVGPVLLPSRIPNRFIGSVNRDRSADLQDTSNLCQKCRRATMQSHGQSTADSSGSCEVCETDPELAWVTQECTRWLTQLGETLSSGISSEQRGMTRGLDQLRLENTGCPPIVDFGLKRTLDWMLDKIYLVNQAADHFAEQIPAGPFQIHKEDTYKNGWKARDGPANIMKRRIDVDPDDPLKLKDDADSSSGMRSHSRRRSVTTSMLTNDDLPPLRVQAHYHPSLPNVDGSLQRVLGVNPPPVPGTRESSSPPRRSILSPSPTSSGFITSSSTSYGINSQGVGFPPLSSIRPPSTVGLLPPMNTSQPPNNALRDHTAALQHEVSIQKIALSSLQSEHDKLLAAFSRSQTRASALEKKHSVSDAEIISLTEEKLRLQAQVIDLERDAEELSRSRNESRLAVIQEAAQYVEIVQRASRLEELAGEERKNWYKLKSEMEAKIEALVAGRKDGDNIVEHAEDAAPQTRPPDDMEMDTSNLLAGPRPRFKLELSSETRQDAPNSHISDPPAPQEYVEELKVEIQNLRGRCADVENALRKIRQDSRSVEDIVKTILERAGSALQS